jgi:hypothetical protein
MKLGKKLFAALCVLQLIIIITTLAARKCFYTTTVAGFFLEGQQPLYLSSSLVHHFSDYSFLLHHHVNRDDLHLLARAMASDFSVALNFDLKKINMLLSGDDTTAPHPTPGPGVSFKRFV